MFGVGCLLSSAPTLGDVWTVGPQPIVYPGTRFPTLGDGSNSYGGTPPYYASMPTDIPTGPPFSLSDFTATDSVTAKTFAEGGVEAKFRTVCGTPSHFAYDDPLIFPGQPGASHLHQFFGNTLANAFSTYTKLRKSGRSNCGGDIFNRTAYWTPALLDTTTGRQRIVRPDNFVVYYTENPMAGSIHLVDIPRDFGYVAGPDPMAGYVDQQVAEVNAANAAAIAAGQPMRYSINTNGFIGWKCENPIGDGTTAYSPIAGGAHQPYLADSSGRPTLNCNTKMPDGTTTAHIVAEFNAPQCWDGKNGHGGPNARGHVRQTITGTNTNTGISDTKVCPDGWHLIPGLIVTIFYPFTNQAEYTAWKWSSDINVNYSYRNGETGHIDWFGAWDYGTSGSPGVMLRWMRTCLGTMGNTPHECDYSSIDTTTRLLSDSNIPTGADYLYADPPGSLRNGRIVDSNHDWITQGSKRFAPVPKGPYVIHGMGH